MSKKTAFVDSASLWHIGRCLGYDHISYFDLERIIAHTGIATEFARKPLMAVTKGAGPNIIENATLAGFEVMRTVEKGADDAQIIQWLDAVDPTIVDEIILVSADSDFVPMMEKKTQQGIKTYWITSKNVQGTDGRPVVGKYLASFLGDFFMFVDMDEFTEQIFYNSSAVRA